MFVHEHEEAAGIHDLCEFLWPQLHRVRHQAALSQAPANAFIEMLRTRGSILFLPTFTMLRSTSGI